MLLISQWVHKEIKEDIKNYLETNGNGNIIFQNLQDAAKILFKRESFYISTFLHFFPPLWTTGSRFSCCTKPFFLIYLLIQGSLSFYNHPVSTCYWWTEKDRRNIHNQVKMKVSQLCPTLCESMEFSRPEYWSRHYNTKLISKC